MKKLLFVFVLLLTIYLETGYPDCSGQKSFLYEVEHADFVGLVSIGRKCFHGYHCRVEEVIAAKDSIPNNIMIWGSGIINGGMDYDHIDLSEGKLQIAAVRMRREDMTLEREYMYYVFTELKGSFHTTVCGNNFVAFKDSVVEGNDITNDPKYYRKDGRTFPREQIDYQEFKKLVRNNFLGNIY